MTQPGSISEDDFPAVYRATDQRSLEAQKRFLRATQVRLGAIVLAAALGAIALRSEFREAVAFLAAAAFACALVAELYLLKVRPERTWYEGRAGAESTKTLTWRWIVGGQPFGVDGLSRPDAERLLLNRYHEITVGLQGLALVPLPTTGDQITAAMRDLRAKPLEDRMSVYLEGRIENQRDWYGSKSRWNHGRANAWSLGLVALEGVALLGALLIAMGTVRFDLPGFAAAGIASGVAWTQTKQYRQLASAYAVASQELAEINARARLVSDESEWSHFVDQSEEAISREHTMWRASRS